MMVQALDKAGFSRAEGRKLMENGVLGKDINIIGKVFEYFKRTKSTSFNLMDGSEMKLNLNQYTKIENAKFFSNYAYPSSFQRDIDIS